MNAPPQYSPDGRWWWTGEQWVPTQPAPRPGSITGSVLAALLIFGVVATLIFGYGREVYKEQERQHEICVAVNGKERC